MRRLRLPSIKRITNKKKSYINKALRKRRVEERRNLRRLKKLNDRGWVQAKNRFLLIVIKKKPCAACGQRDIKKLQCDHIIPKALGGPNALWNMQVLCKKCHRKKTNQDLKAIKMFRQKRR